MTRMQAFGYSTMEARFTSPEQLRGEDLSPSCDVYALSALLTELFGAKPIWDKLTNHTITYHIGEMPKFDHMPRDVL